MLGQQHYKLKYNGRLCYTQPPIYVEKSMIYDSQKSYYPLQSKNMINWLEKNF